MLSQSDILFGVALPAVIAIVLLAITWRRSATPKGAWGAAAALSAGLMAAFWPIVRHSPFNFSGSSDSLDWIFTIALVLGVLGSADALFNLPGIVRLLWVSAVALGGYCVLLRPVANNWQAPEKVGWFAALTAAAVLSWLVLEGIARRVPSALTPILLTILCCATAVLLALSGSLKLGQLAGSLAGPLFIIVLFTFWRRSHLLMRGVVPVLVILLAGLSCYGYFFASIVPSHAILLLLAPVFAFVAEVSLDVEARAWKRWLCVLGALIIPLGIAVALAYVNFQENYAGY